jgi:hypothetical protein
MATSHVDLTEECLGDLPGYIVVAGCERNTRFNAGRDEFRWVTKKKKKAEGGSAHFSAHVVRIHPSRWRNLSKNPLAAINEFRLICEAVVREHESLFSASTVLVDLERVDANLGFEEGVENRVTGEREG